MSLALATVGACTTPSAMPHASDSSTGGSSASSGGLTSSSTGSAGPATFGMDGPDDGSEVGFVPPLDIACAPATGAAHCALCDVRAQSCIDGFKCAPWSQDGADAWNGARCVPIPARPVGVGEACTVEDAPVSGLDDCAAGSMCWGAGGVDGEGTCVPFCAPPAGAEPECPAGTACLVDGLEVLALCLPPCDPLDPASCPAAHACRYFSASTAAFCVPDEGGRVSSPTIQCGSEDEECPEQEVCISAATYGGCGAPSCCTRWCDHEDPGADAECDANRPGHVCVPLFDREPAPEGYASLGFCAEPPA